MSFFSVLSLIALFTVVTASPANGPVYKTERDLRRDIFRCYDKFVRPVKRATTAVPVEISISPMSLRSMNEKDQIIILESWSMLKWTDEYLRWDPRVYDNITELHVPSTEIWKPDIALYSASGDNSYFPNQQSDVTIDNNGTVIWVPPFTINSRCPVPVRGYVSFSRTFVECTIRIGSWTYSGKYVDLQLLNNKVDLTDFHDNNYDWKLVKIIANRESRLYPCCVDEYPIVNFNITLKKRNFDLNNN